LRLVPREGLLFVIALAAWPQFVSVRPQMFSLAAFAWLLYELERFRRRTDRGLWRLPMLFTLWVNLHGGWLVGAGVLVLFTAVTLLNPVFEMRRRVRLLAAGVASAAATLINPYGPAMLGFLADTVRPERADILEWSPITALPPIHHGDHGRAHRAGIAAAWRGGRAIPAQLAGDLRGAAIGALRVARLVGFCGIAVGFLLAPYLIAPAGEASGALAPAYTARRRPGVWATELVFAIALIVVAVGVFGRTIAMDGEWQPEPARSLRSRHIICADGC
jgi:hypothetical protein